MLRALRKTKKQKQKHTQKTLYFCPRPGCGNYGDGVGQTSNCAWKQCGRTRKDDKKKSCNCFFKNGGKVTMRPTE